MDSLTQALLGANTFALIKNKSLGTSSLFIGAVVGTIPDLDVLLAPLFNEVAFISVHRSITHSIFFAILGSLLLAYFAHKITASRYLFKHWFWAFFWALSTHSLLDCFTTYGTKLLSPLNGYLFSFNSIHVFEPIYTSILLLGMMYYLFKNTNRISQQTILKRTLLISSFYLCWTFVSKSIAHRQFVQALNFKNIHYQKILVSPTPLNTLLWNGIVKTKDGYYFGLYSLLDGDQSIEFQFVKSDYEIIPQILKYKEGRQYLAYTQDFPLIQLVQDTVKIYAVKFGPVNCYGPPLFVHPLCLNLQPDKVANFRIEKAINQVGPVKSYPNLWRRIMGNQVPY
jgi:inner membrane protein